jgi:hypothetical protein
MNEDPRAAAPLNATSGSTAGQTRPENGSAGGRPAAPIANPFDVTTAYATVLRCALALALLPGLGLGLLMVLVFGLHLPWSAAWPQLTQAHGQIQTLGFTVLFVVAVGLQLFPRFLGAPLRSTRPAVGGALLVMLALLARLVGQPLAPGFVRALLLGVAAVGLPIGILLAGSAFHGLSRRSVQPASGPSAAWRRFVAVGGLALGAALLLALWSGLLLAAGAPVVPQGLDEALIHLELAGFATSVVFGVASRIFGRFLLLRTRPALDRRLPRLAGLWAVGLVLVVGGWLAGPPWGVWPRLAGSLLQLGTLGTWLWWVGLYQPPVRASGTPYVTEPTRRWIRLAFAFLVFSLALDSGLFAREAFQGVAPLTTELSAARHALAQGFLLPLMVAMAARLLPIYSADVLKRKRQLEVTVDLLLFGALLRVGAEVLGGYAGGAGLLVALGGTLSVGGFVLFAIGLWSSLGRLPRAQPSKGALSLPVLGR